MQLRQRAWVAARNFLYAELVFGRGHELAKPVYDRLIAIELAAARARDGRFVFPPASSVTALIKTFERPQTVRRLVASIHRLYPWMPIVVVDDSREPRDIPGTTVVKMPFDSGLSAGRNEGLRHVKTSNVLLLDDDFVLTRRTRVDAALEALESPRIDLVGGRVSFLPFYLEQAKPEYGEGRIERWRVCEKVPNFFVARTERLKLVPWDERLKLVEHMDFFLRAQGVLTTVYEPRMECLHARTLFDAHYMQKRAAVGPYVEILREKLAARGRAS